MGAVVLQHDGTEVRVRVRLLYLLDELQTVVCALLELLRGGEVALRHQNEHRLGLVELGNQVVETIFLQLVGRGHAQHDGRGQNEIAGVRYQHPVLLLGRRLYEHGLERRGLLRWREVRERTLTEAKCRGCFPSLWLAEYRDGYQVVRRNVVGVAVPGIVPQTLGLFRRQLVVSEDVGLEH